MVKTNQILLIGITEAFGNFQGSWVNPFAQKTPTKAGAKWLPWGAWNACTGVCGNGVQTRVRRCLNGIPGTDCIGETLNSKPCDSFTEDRCSYWSGWGEWTQSTTCPDPITKMCTRRKTRTCYGRNTDMCDGPTVFEKTEPCEYPPTNTKIIYNPPERCCPCDNPDCGEKIVTEDNPCFSQQPGPTRIPVPMPLCEKECKNTRLGEPEIFCPHNGATCQGRWIRQEKECQYGKIEADGIFRWSSWQILEPHTEPAEQDPICDPVYTEIQPCTGKHITSGTYAGKQCPGYRLEKKSCECYADGCTHSRNGLPLNQIRNETCGEPAGIPNDFHYIIMHNDRVDECGNRIGTDTKKAHYLSEAEAVDFCSSKCGLEGFSIIKREIDPCSDWEKCSCGIISEVTLPCGGFESPIVSTRSEDCPNWTEQPWLQAADVNPADCPAWIAAPSMNNPDAGYYERQFARIYETVTHTCTVPNLSTCRANVDGLRFRVDAERVVSESPCAPPQILVGDPECPRLPTPEQLTWELCQPNSLTPAACQENYIEIPKQVKCRGPTSNKKKFCKAEFPAVQPVQTPCMANTLAADNIRPDPRTTVCDSRQVTQFYLTGLITKSAVSICPEYCADPTIIACQHALEVTEQAGPCVCNRQNCDAQPSFNSWGRSWSRFSLGVRETWCQIGNTEITTQIATQSCTPEQETFSRLSLNQQIHVEPVLLSATWMSNPAMPDASVTTTKLRHATFNATQHSLQHHRQRIQAGPNTVDVSRFNVPKYNVQQQ
jgi:hypothetical protein